MNDDVQILIAMAIALAIPVGVGIHAIWGLLQARKEIRRLSIEAWGTAD